MLTEDGVFPRHALLFWDNWSWVILPLDSRADVKVNGRAVAGGTRIRSGDEIQISHLVFRLEIS